MTEGLSDPTEFFELVANERRVDILRALADAYAEDPTGGWVEYSELKDAAGIRDNGNFNYHLDRLEGLVAKEPEGYVLAPPGMALLSTLYSGSFDPEWTWGPVEAPGDCPFCSDPVRLYYEDGVLWLTCGDDDHEMGLLAPPSLLETHPDDEVIERIARLGTHYGGLLRRNVCPDCKGYVEGSISYGGIQPDHYYYGGECERCRFPHGLPLGAFVLDLPAVIAFYHDHGVDVREAPFWTLEFCDPGSETVASENPLRLRVDAECEGETLSATLAEDGSVVATERSRD
jgi:hypothetical protein